jgi:hypothetical protein
MQIARGLGYELLVFVLVVAGGCASPPPPLPVHQSLLFAPVHIELIKDSVERPRERATTVLKRWENAGSRLDIDTPVLVSMGSRELLGKSRDLCSASANANTRLELADMLDELTQIANQLSCTPDTVEIALRQLAQINEQVPAMKEAVRSEAQRSDNVFTILEMFVVQKGAFPAAAPGVWEDANVLGKSVVARSTMLQESGFQEQVHQSQLALQQILDWFKVDSRTVKISCKKPRKSKILDDNADTLSGAAATPRLASDCPGEIAGNTVVPPPRHK